MSVCMIVRVMMPSSTCLFVALCVVCSCLRIHGRSIEFNWTLNRVESYRTYRSPLKAELGDMLILRCGQNVSNLFIQTEKIQYDSCNASAGSGMFKYNGFCPAPGSDIRLTLTENSQDLTNTVNFINNSIYYFTSYYNGVPGDADDDSINSDPTDSSHSPVINITEKDITHYIIGPAIIVSLVVIIVVVTIIVAVIMKDKKSRMSHADLNNNPLYYDSGHSDKESGVWSMLRLDEQESQLSSQRNAQGTELIYADIYPQTFGSHHTKNASSFGVLSSINKLSSQHNDDQVQYAEVKQQTTDPDVTTEAMPSAGFSSSPEDSLLDLDSLLVQLRPVVTSKWYEFGVAVGIPREILDKYSCYPPDECIVKVLDFWLISGKESGDKKPTWRDVAKALEELELYKLAESVLKNQQHISTF